MIEVWMLVWCIAITVVLVAVMWSVADTSKMFFKDHTKQYNGIGITEPTNRWDILEEKISEMDGNWYRSFKDFREEVYKKTFKIEETTAEYIQILNSLVSASYDNITSKIIEAKKKEIGPLFPGEFLYQDGRNPLILEVKRYPRNDKPMEEQIPTSVHPLNWRNL
jgi:hypothetical protein